MLLFSDLSNVFKTYIVKKLLFACLSPLSDFQCAGFQMSFLENNFPQKFYFQNLIRRCVTNRYKGQKQFYGRSSANISYFIQHDFMTALLLRSSQAAFTGKTLRSEKQSFFKSVTDITGQQEVEEKLSVCPALGRPEVAAASREFLTEGRN